MVLFNNWRDTRARTVQRINFRPEQGDSQAGDKVGDSKNDCAKQNCAPYYAAKTGFLVRKEMVRSEVRSKTGYIFWLTEQVLTVK